MIFADYSRGLRGALGALPTSSLTQLLPSSFAPVITTTAAQEVAAGEEPAPLPPLPKSSLSLLPMPIVVQQPAPPPPPPQQAILNPGPTPAQSASTMPVYSPAVYISTPDQVPVPVTQRDSQGPSQGVTYHATANAPAPDVAIDQQQQPATALVIVPGVWDRKVLGPLKGKHLVFGILGAILGVGAYKAIR